MKVFLLAGLCLLVMLVSLVLALFFVLKLSLLSLFFVCVALVCAGRVGGYVFGRELEVFKIG